mmetsp:Transcript_3019/g.6821  ORF Transcript_3019/g.6821 Transcript_3019/m.6821 type:complete len:255 (+) Transcript_3019:53-817(+)
MLGKTSGASVVVFGWWGCSDRQLQRVEEMYKTIGVESVLCISCPWGCVGEEGAQQHVKLFVDQVRALRGKLVAHTFSNGGMWLQRAMLTETDVSGRFCCFILDSTPGLLTFTTLTGVMATIPGVKKGMLCFSPFLAFCFYRAVRIVAEKTSGHPLVQFGLICALCFMVFRNPFNDRYQRSVRDAPNRGAELYLYSKEDRLVSWKNVEDVVDFRAKTGVATRKYCFVGSPHIAHLKTFPDAYAKQVGDFLEKQLG